MGSSLLSPAVVSLLPATEAPCSPPSVITLIVYIQLAAREGKEGGGGGILTVQYELYVQAVRRKKVESKFTHLRLCSESKNNTHTHTHTVQA